MMRNISDYSLLAIFGVLYLVAIYRYQTTPQFVLIATAGFCVVYIFWGILHHLRNRNFHAKIMLEYLLVALLGIAIVSTLLL